MKEHEIARSNEGEELFRGPREDLLAPFRSSSALVATVEPWTI